MARMSSLGRAVAVVAIVGALLVPASNALAGSGPVAHKSGAIVNYASAGKLRVAKHIQIFFTCAVTCDATSTSIIKGLGAKITIPASAQLPPGTNVVQLTIKGVLLKAMKARPGAFKIVSRIGATDPATGATDQIARTFRVKR
jgi:hypothetical protein